MVFHKSWVYRFAVLVLLTALAGMGCMPNSMQVRDGLDPRYQDDDARFRTVYYFRVFEYCEDKGEDKNNGIPKKVIQKDNLYRFLMTGKGSSLWNDIHFESGTLQQSQIDPFGALLSYDEDSRQFKFKSTEEMAMQNRQKNLKLIDDEFTQLLKFRNENGAHFTDGGNQQPGNSFKDEYDKFLVKRAKNINSNFLKITSTPATASKSATTCSDSTPANQEFWILGPEGWRKFNPDERLVLAMSSSGKPLISAMKEISGRLLNEKSAASGNEITPIKEWIKADKALDKFKNLDEDANSTKVEESIKKVIKFLKAKEEMSK